MHHVDFNFLLRDDYEQNFNLTLLECTYKRQTFISTVFYSVRTLQSQLWRKKTAWGNV